MFKKAVELSKSKVQYWDEKGSTVIFEGGNRTWRNQNPGNIGAVSYTHLTLPTSDLV